MSAGEVTREGFVAAASGHADPQQGSGDRRRDLRVAGVAVRRGNTFPGLGPDHLRVAVRPHAAVRVLVEALSAALTRVPA